MVSAIVQVVDGDKSKDLKDNTLRVVLFCILRFRSRPCACYKISRCVSLIEEFSLESS